MFQKKDKLFDILLILLLVLLVGYLSFNLFDLTNILEEKQIISSFIVSDHPGFDLNDSVLTFGMIPAGQSGSRSLELFNNFNSSIKVVVTVKGDIKNYVFVSDNDFILNSNENRTLEFFVLTNKDTEHKKYEGIIEIIFKRF